MQITKAKAATNAQIRRQGTGRLAKIAWNNCLTRQGRQIEITKAGAFDERRIAVGVRACKAGPLGKLAILIRVDPGDDIERRSRAGDDKGTESQLPQLGIVISTEH